MTKRKKRGPVLEFLHEHSLSLVFAGIPASGEDAETFDAVFADYRLRGAEASIAAAGD